MSAKLISLRLFVSVRKMKRRLITGRLVLFLSLIHILALVIAAKNAIRNGLALLGMKAPEKM